MIKKNIYLISCILTIILFVVFVLILTNTLSNKNELRISKYSTDAYNNLVLPYIEQALLYND